MPGLDYAPFWFNSQSPHLAEGVTGCMLLDINTVTQAAQ